MRKLAREVARHKMKKAGYTQINKKGADGRSKFSKLWRQYI